MQNIGRVKSTILSNNNILGQIAKATEGSRAKVIWLESVDLKKENERISSLGSSYQPKYQEACPQRRNIRLM